MKLARIEIWGATTFGCSIVAAIAVVAAYTNVKAELTGSKDPFVQADETRTPADERVSPTKNNGSVDNILLSEKPKWRETSGTLPSIQQMDLFQYKASCSSDIPVWLDGPDGLQLLTRGTTDFAVVLSSNLPLVLNDPSNPIGYVYPLAGFAWLQAKSTSAPSYEVNIVYQSDNDLELSIRRRANLQTTLKFDCQGAFD